MRITLSLFMIFIMVSCSQIVSDESVKVEYSESQEIIEFSEVEIMDVLPVKGYQNYVVSGKKVFGINGSKLEPVEFASKKGGKLSPLTFFKKSGKLYFSIQTFEPGKTEDDPSVEKIICFSQEKDKLSIIASLPACPESERVEYESAPYQVKKTSYGEIATSTVMRGAKQEAYICIDGAVKVESGLWFSVSEPYKNTGKPGERIKGVYFYPLEGSKVIALPEGRIF